MFCGTVVGKHLCICCGGHRVLGNTAVYVVRLTECWETLLYMLRGSPSAGKHCCICCEACRVLGNTAVYVVRLTECWETLLYMLWGLPSAGKHCCICCEAHRMLQKLCSSNYFEAHKSTFTCTVVMCHVCKYFLVCMLYRQKQWTYFSMCDF